jgi:hypothetical protein
MRTTTDTPQHTKARPKGAPERRLLDVEEGRGYIGGIARESFYRLVRSGEIRTVHIGRRTFVEKAELDRFIDRLVEGV